MGREEGGGDICSLGMVTHFFSFLSLSEYKVCGEFSVELREGDSCSTRKVTHLFSFLYLWI